MSSRSRALLLSLSLCCLSSATDAIAQITGGGVIPGSSSAAPAASTLLTSSTTQVCTAADTNETTAWTFNLPANTLNENGKAIRVFVTAALGVNGNTKTLNVKVGGTTVGSRSTTQSGGATSVYSYVIRTGAATEQAYGDNAAGTGGFQAALSSDTTAAIAITATIQNGTASASDVCLKSATVELLQTTTNTIVTSTGGPVANPILLPNGTVSLPSLSFAALTNTGIYRPSHDSGNAIGLALAGTEVAAFVSGGMRLAGTMRFNAGSVDGTDTTGPAVLKDASNVLSIENTTNAQLLRIYGTKTDSSNYERVAMGYDSANTRYVVQTENAGTGTARNLNIGTNGSAEMQLRTNGSTRWRFDGSGHMLAATDNTFDIGAIGATRPRSIFAGTNVWGANALITGTTTANAGSVRLPNNGPIAARNAANTADANLLTLTAQDITAVQGSDVSLADTATASLGASANGTLFIYNTGDNRMCQFELRGAGNATTELADPGTICSTTAATASSLNVYWSAGNVRYEIENRRGATRVVRLVLIGFGS